MKKRTHGQTKEARARTQAKYNSTPEQRKRRAERNRTRYLMEKKGLVHKGDGNDVDHKDHNTANMSMNNLAVQSKHVNRKDGGPRKKKRMVDVLTSGRK